MKGLVAKSLEELVINKFGENHWKEILKKSNLPEDLKIYSHKDIPDEVIVNVIHNTCEELGITFEQAADAFGDYWINDFVSKKYFAFFKKGIKAKEFLLEMNRVHEKMTDKMENAHPPRFDFEDIDKNTLIMSYHSERNLEPIWLGIIKGVGRYYNEKLDLSLLAKNKVKIVFS